MNVSIKTFWEQYVYLHDVEFEVLTRSAPKMSESSSRIP
jgi:hypothetical protein